MGTSFNANAEASRARRKESVKKYDDKRQDWRKRAWQCVVYPESAPSDWMERLHSQGIAYDISPLHDKDLNAEGDKKKPHYHVILDFGAGHTQSGDGAIEIFDIIGGVYPDPKKDRKKFLEACKVKKIESAWRYLCHLDEHDPAKVQYDVSEVISGFHELPYSDRCMKAMEKDEMTLEMCDYVVSNDIYDFATFVIRARNDHPEWMHAIINDKPGTFVNRFINGRLTANREEREKKKYLMNKWRYEKETGLPTPEIVLGRAIDADGEKRI